MQEMKELAEATDQYHAAPLEDNMLEWHFTIKGPDGTDFEGGIYHGRITLPPEYPMKPPSIIMLTPNGRFEVGKKICLSISAYHPETWQPSWSIRTALMALIGFMPTEGKGAVAALDYTPAERKDLARKSVTWTCPTCGSENHTHLKHDHKAPEQTAAEKEAISQLVFKGEEKKKEESSTEQTATPAETAPVAPTAPEPPSESQPTSAAPVAPSAPKSSAPAPMPRAAATSPAKPRPAAGASGAAATKPPSSGIGSQLLIIALVVFLGFLLWRKASRMDNSDL